MKDPTGTGPKSPDVYAPIADLGRKVPTREELFLTPMGIVSTLCEITPKIAKTDAWWALTGDLAENLLDVHVRPTEVEILTDAAGLVKVREALSEYGPTAIAPMERRLEREAEPDGKKYPVSVRSSAFEFSVRGGKVTVMGDYAMKVGEWEWGDPLMFEPVYVNVAGIQIPLIPLRLRSEFYITLGWMDRAQLISEATQRAHAFMEQFLGEGTR